MSISHQDGCLYSMSFYINILAFNVQDSLKLSMVEEAEETTDLLSIIKTEKLCHIISNPPPICSNKIAVRNITTKTLIKATKETSTIKPPPEFIHYCTSIVFENIQ